MEETSRLDKPLLDSGITLVKRHSLSQLKLPNKSSGAEFCKILLILKFCENILYTFL